MFLFENIQLLTGTKFWQEEEELELGLGLGIIFRNNNFTDHRDSIENHHFLLKLFFEYFNILHNSYDKFFNRAENLNVQKAKVYHN